MAEPQQQQGEEVLEVAVQRPGQQQVVKRFAAAPGAATCSAVESKLQQEFGPGNLCRDEVVLLPSAQLQPGIVYVYNVLPGGAAAAAAAAGRTAYDALNSCLPQGTVGDLTCSSSSSAPGFRLQPGEVLPWQHAEPQGQVDLLDQAIQAYQANTDNQESRLHVPPATLREPMDSEAEVASWLQAWVATPLAELARQESAHATWKQLPPNNIIHDAVIQTGAHGVEGQQAAAVTTRSGRLSRPPSAAPSQPQHFGGRRHKMDFVLVVQEQPSSKRRCVCVGEVKKPGELLSAQQSLPDLVAAYQQQDSDKHRQATAALSQVYTYLQLWRMCHGFISCWFGTWLVYCPPQQRGKLYVSRPYSASSAVPEATVMGALAWLQHQALQVDPTTVLAYTPPATGQAGAEEGSPGSSGPDDGARTGSGDEWPHDQHDKRPGGGSRGAGGGGSSSSKSQQPGGGSRGAGGSSSKSQQPGGMVTLLLQHKLQQGSEGAVVAGSYGGLPAVVKLLGPDRQGLAAFENETAVYAMLGAVQGTLVPRLLGTGSLLGGVVRFIATSKVDGAPLSSLPTVPTATAQAALEALARLHRECEGFLHNDIRLANVIVLAGSGSDVSPQCMLLDFGRSRFDGSKAEQHREFMALKKLLGA